MLLKKIYWKNYVILKIKICVLFTHSHKKIKITMYRTVSSCGALSAGHCCLLQFCPSLYILKYYILP